MKWTMELEGWNWGDNAGNHELHFDLKLGMERKSDLNQIKETEESEKEQTSLDNFKPTTQDEAAEDRPDGRKKPKAKKLSLTGWMLEMPKEMVVINITNDKAVKQEGVSLELETLGKNQILRFKFPYFGNGKKIIFDPTQQAEGGDLNLPDSSAFKLSFLITFIISCCFSFLVL